MNGTTNTSAGRSVQLAVMAAPSTSIVEAVAEARRRHDSSGGQIAPVAAPRARQLALGAA